MSLFPTFQFGSIDLASYPFAVEFGSDRGSAAAVVERVASALRNGSLARVTRYDNRTVTIPVLIEGPTMVDLADAEALLVAEASKPRNEFTFNPGDGWAADSVFDTFTAELIPQYDDNLEMNGYRRFELTFEAHPHPRSAAKVVTPAVTTSPPTVVDSGSATTDWSAPFGPTGAGVSVSSGAVRSTYDPSLTIGSGLYGTNLRRTAAVDVSTSKYLALDWMTSKPSYFGLQTNATVGNLPEVRREPAPVAGFTRSWFQIPDAVTSLAWFQFVIVHTAYPTGTATLDIDQVLLANALPAVGTARQKVATIYPVGSVPAEGTVILQHETAGLGSTVVFTHPIRDGYTPPLRQWRLTGTTPVADALAVSGFYSFLDTPIRFFIPIDSVPTGDVHLWARVARNAIGSTTFTGNARSAFSGVYIGASQPYTTTINFGAAFTYFMVPLARFTLPTAKVGMGGYVQIDIAGDAATWVDEAWLFAMDEGNLTVVECGTGTPSAGSVANRLLVNAPTPEEPFGSIMVATRADFADAYSPNVGTVLCDQVGHKFHTEGSMIFTVASGPTTEAAVSLEHYPRWHTNAGS